MKKKNKVKHKNISKSNKPKTKGSYKNYRYFDKEKDRDILNQLTETNINQLTKSYKLNINNLPNSLVITNCINCNHLILDYPKENRKYCSDNCRTQGIDKDLKYNVNRLELIEKQNNINLPYFRFKINQDGNLTYHNPPYKKKLVTPLELINF